MKEKNKDVEIVSTEIQPIESSESEALAIEEFKKNYVGERVNLNDIESIFHYGEDILLQLGEVVNASSSDLGSRKIGEAEKKIKEKIGYMTHFNENLDKEDELQQKIEQNETKLLGKLANRLTGNIKLLGRDTYADAEAKVEKYCEELKDIVDETGAAVTEDFVKGIQYQSQQEECLQALNNTIIMGKIDLQEYEARIDLKEQQGPQPGEDPQLFDLQIEKARNNIEDMKDKLATLESVKNLGYIDLGKNMELHKVNKSSLKQLYNIKTATLPMIKVVGKDAIRQRNAADTLSVIESINDGLNEAVLSNSQKALENIKKSQQLETKGTIYTSTLKQVVKDLQTGQKLIEQSEETRKKALAERTSANAQAEQDITKALEAIKRTINYNENDNELLEAMSLPELPQRSTATVEGKNPLLKSIKPLSGNKQ